MKRATLSTFLLIGIIHYCFAHPAIPNGKNKGQQSHYADTSSTHIPSIQEMLLDITNTLGLQPDFKLKEAKVPNIEALISHRKRYILYNPLFISWISRATKDKWGVIALLAHEIGHYVDGHTRRKGGSNPRVELEADEFAGFVLNKLGATIQQAGEVMYYISNEQASITHPARASRIEAIEKGWKKALAQKT